jgi:hypothetical protein
MKRNSVKIISAVVAGLLTASSSLYAQGGTDSRIGSIQRERVDHGATEAKGITKAEAEKKYPPPKGGYPVGQRDPHDPSGVTVSPYPPHERYNCSKIAHGGLVIDATANKVFVRP